MARSRIASSDGSNPGTYQLGGRGPRVGALVGQVSGEHLVEHGAHRVDVGARIAAAAPDLLRRHVVGRAHGGGERSPGEPARRGEDRDAEVEQLHLALRRHQHVLRLDVAVEHPLGVEVGQGGADLAGEVEGLLGGERVLAEQRSQRTALHVLHHHVHPALLGGGEHLHHVGVVQPLADLVLAPEALVEDHVALELYVRNLERHGLAADGVDGLEDGGHAAAGQELGELELVEQIADGWVAQEPAGVFDDIW